MRRHILQERAPQIIISNEGNANIISRALQARFDKLAVPELVLVPLNLRKVEKLLCFCYAKLQFVMVLLYCHGKICPLIELQN